MSYAGVLAAAQRIAPLLPPTPAWSYPLLDAAAGTHVVCKHENVQPTGAFKVRGGIALFADADPGVGVITASTGNHAQSIAYAATRVGIDAVVVMPAPTAQGRVDAVRALGAEVVLHGPTMGEALEHALVLADDQGRRFIHPGGEMEIVHGHATVSLELFREHPDLEALYVPLGSGTGAVGACLVRAVLAQHCRIIAVQSAQAPAAYESWRARELRVAPCTTRAAGLATSSGFPLTQEVLWDALDDFILVDDDAIDAARRLLATTAHTLAEGAGAAALAGLLADPDRPERCGVIISGGNADPRELATLAAGGPTQ